jgi:outer membrane protein W
MKKLAVLMLVFTTIFFMSTSVYAAGGGIGKGSTEVYLSGNLIHSEVKVEDTKAKVDQISYLVGAGYFLTDAIQVGLSHLGSITEGKNGESAKLTTMTYDLFAKYYFYSKGQTFAPYVGIQGGWVQYDLNVGADKYSKGVGNYGAMAGLKFFLTENITFNTELNYRHFDFTVDETKVTVDQTAVLVGVSYFF